MDIQRKLQLLTHYNRFKESTDLYKEISMSIEYEFQDKYYKYMDSYNGLYGLFEKVSNYKKLIMTKCIY